MAFTRQDMAWCLFLFTCHQTCHIVAFHEAEVERHIMHISTWLATKMQTAPLFDQDGQLTAA